MRRFSIFISKMTSQLFIFPLSKQGPFKTSFNIWTVNNNKKTIWATRLATLLEHVNNNNNKKTIYWVFMSYSSTNNPLNLIMQSILMTFLGMKSGGGGVLGWVGGWGFKFSFFELWWWEGSLKLNFSLPILSSLSFSIF